MPTILNSLQPGNIGIQSYNTAINQGNVAPGRGAALVHTNGNTYCVWAETSTDQLTRGLFFASSSDNGFTWSTAIQITSGNWDDDPAITQLDLTNSSSDLGLIFTRIGASSVPYVYRTTVSISGSVTFSIDVVSNGTTSLSGIRYLNLNVLTGGDFLISGFALSNGTYPVLWYNPTSYTSNNWVPYTNNLSSAIGSIFPVSWRMHKVANGDFVAIFAGRTSYNGSGWGAAPEGTVKTDLYFMSCPAVDNAQTWGSPQNLTSYTGSPQFDLAGFANAIDADLVQFNDGSITAMYAEALAPQFSSTTGTTPLFNGNIGLMSALAYSAPLNCVLIGGQTSGFFVYNLTAQTFVRFDTSTTPELWSNAVTNISVSANGAYVAVCTQAVAPQTTGSLEIFATGGSSDATTWTSTSLRTTTTPATHSTPANTVFQDNAFLLVGWTNSGISNVALSRIDCSNISLGFTDFTTTGFQTCDTYRTSTLYANGVVHFSSGSSVCHYDVAGGSPGTFYSVSLGFGSLSDAAYDDVNKEWFYLGTSTAHVTDNGSSMTSSTLSNTLVGNNTTWLVSVPGAGMLYYNNPPSNAGNNAPFAKGIGYYSFTGKTFFGTFEGQLEYNYSRSWIDATSVNGVGPTLPTYMNGWMVFVTNINGVDLRAISMSSVGRMRIGNGTYSGGNLTISTFYDMVNQVKLGTQGTKVVFPNTTVSGDNTVIMVANETSYDNSLLPGPIRVFTATVAPDSQTLSIRCDIRNKSTQTIQIRAWRSRRTTQQVLCQARIAHEACIKIQARIVPRVAKTIQVQAAIKNYKQTIVLGTFNIQANQSTIVTGTFNIAGLWSGQRIGMGCRIARSVTRRVVGHFVISATPTTSPLQSTFSFGGTVRSNAVLGIGAYIS